MTLTKQQIIALAVEAGFDDITPWLDAENVEKGQIDSANRWIERMTAFAALVSSKETEARIKLQREFMEYQNDMQARGTRLIKEAYQRGVRDERNACLSEIETGIWLDKTTEEVLADIAAAIRSRSATQQQPSGWHRAVDEEMVLTHLGISDPSDSYETAKKKLNDLIAWHVAVATDPAVNGGYVLMRQDSATIPPSSTTE